MAGKRTASLSWRDLNTTLLECEDVPTLRRWLSEVVAEGRSLHRALRVHGRLNAVRHAQEVAAIKAGTYQPLKGNPRHGTRSRYVQGCRCLPCRAASAEYGRVRMRERRKKEKEEK